MLSIKETHYAGRGHFRSLRFVNWYFGRAFHPFFPMYAWVIEHPEGLIVIDSGDTARSLDPAFYPASTRPFFLAAFKYQIRPEDAIGPQMRELGLAPEAVRWVVMTHLHMDHSNGLDYFPNAEFLVAPAEKASVDKLGAFHGCVPTQWPAFFQPDLVQYTDRPYGAFKQHFPLTRAEDVVIVPTPGHTAGHQSVILRATDHEVMFAGDVSFNIPTLLKNTLDGVTVSAPQITRTRGVVRDHMRRQPTVYLPSHDHESGKRLADQQIFAG
jgi:glyoxylase-like metal-dependent hydrolase (beta-lactamase superfamily II)